ncbi:MAG: methionyl-tRNA formyltransferase [Bacteroidetes bacterium]|nr:methionyl-tRNA formyltransferase [Bacteroidota bacterium]MCL5034384.1 methionyl-tRNA formyltransferase [Bacteroidota bacterium]
MKIVFMGTPEFAVPSLRAIVQAGYEVAAVVTNPDEPQGRGLKVFPPAVKTAALELGLAVIQVESLKDPEFLRKLRGIAPDLMVVVAFRILPKEVFTVPRLGTFNLHSSLLPKYRGAAPINWAVVNGETETGITAFFLDEKMDTGKVILQKKTDIGENETAGELTARLSVIGAAAVVETIKLIESGNVKLIDQENSLATRAPKISKDDCAIEWNRPAKEVHDFIRGFSPEPGAFTFLNGKMLKVFRTRLAHERANLPAGSVKVETGRLFAACSDGLVEILELQLEGKKRLAAAEFLRGARVAAGTNLTMSRA